MTLERDSAFLCTLLVTYLLQYGCGLLQPSERSFTVTLHKG